MNNYKNDPRMTAYLLNELSPEEKDLFEKELQNNAKAIEELQNLKRTMNVLRNELKKEPLQNFKMNVKTKKEALFSFKKIKYWIAVPGTLALLYFYFIPIINLKIAALSEGVFGKAETMVDSINESDSYDSIAKMKSEISSHLSMANMSRAMPRGNVSYPEGSIPSSQLNSEEYDRLNEEDFQKTADQPLSTFSTDVDTAAYSNVRRFLNMNQKPPVDAVRIEELINYFTYDYALPQGDDAFAIHLEQASCPWKKEHQLVRIGLKAKEVVNTNQAGNNFVFLIDVSGSMQDSDKLPLLKKAFAIFVENLKENDRVSIVTYAISSEVVLPATKGNERQKIQSAIENLNAGGGTAGASGIELAYKIAQENFMKDGNNRIVLATDGDFNLGLTHRGGLTRLVEEKAKDGVFLTILGVGTGNYKDSQMKSLSSIGNGNYFYIDQINEAQKVLGHNLFANMTPVAKDAKIQVEFNPNLVNAYRLIGYVTRKLNHQDFNNDKKDAGDVGSGHTVTALYEIVPKGVSIDLPDMDKLKYQNVPTATSTEFKSELLTVKVRYKNPTESTSKLLSESLNNAPKLFDSASRDFRLASSVALFGMLLSQSKYSGDMSYNDVLEMAKAAKGKDPYAYEAEFIELIEKAKNLNK